MSIFDRLLGTARKPPARPAGIRVYTDDEATEAQAYADEVGGQVERLGEATS